MAEFHTSNTEEILIQKIIGKDGLGFSSIEGESNLPKYYILRIALSLALKLPKLPLRNKAWDDKRLQGQKGKEYHIEQITGKGKANNEDFDSLTRSMFYAKYKSDLELENINIFTNDEAYLKILSLHIHRGLYEISNTWKSNDCFYQWCIDNLGLNTQDCLESKNASSIESKTQNTQNYFEKIKQYFAKFSINLEHINTTPSYRHDIVRLKVQDATKIESFKGKFKHLEDEIGRQNLMLQSCKQSGLSRTYDIQIPKNETQWQKIGAGEFLKGLESISKSDYKLGIFAGFSIDKIAYCFDLVTAPHLFIAGSTGSGKSTLMQNIIISLLSNKNKPEIVLIDPKLGLDYAAFTPYLSEMIYDMSLASEYLDKLIQEMELRYSILTKANTKDLSAANLKHKVIIIDELNIFVSSDKSISEKLEALALKARASGIHLILSPQRPDSASFSGNLRQNTPARIALRVAKATDSRIILDESGAEKLLGSGDMLLKLQGMHEPKRLLSPHLNPQEIESILLKSYN